MAKSIQSIVELSGNLSKEKKKKKTQGRVVLEVHKRKKKFKRLDCLNVK